MAKVAEIVDRFALEVQQIGRLLICQQQSWADGVRVGNRVQTSKNRRDGLVCGRRRCDGSGTPGACSVERSGGAAIRL